MNNAKFRKTAFGLIGFILGQSALAFCQIPSTPGWYTIQGTNLRSVCPANGFGGSGYNFRDLCNRVTENWNGGAVDTLRNRLIVWGGGHNDYYGNELYAVDLNSLNVQRLTDPGLPLAPNSPCNESIAGGSQPNSRHTYGGVTYLPNVDKLWAAGGSLACGGGYFSAEDVWIYDFAASGSGTKWTHRTPSVSGVTPGGHPGYASAYDPNRQLVFFNTQEYLYSYNYATNTTVQIGQYRWIDYYKTGVIDPDRKLFILVGDGEVISYDISTGSSVGSIAPVNRSTSGGSALVNDQNPGLAYDPVSKQVVAWSGGNTVYSLNTSTWTWTSVSYSGGPSATSLGVFGRWGYVPNLRVFVTVNYVDSNAAVFRLSTGTPPPPDTTPPSMPSAVSATSTSSSQISVSWTASTDNVGVAGYRVYRCQGAGCTPSTQVATVAAVTSYSDAGLSAATTYVYRVAAYDAAGYVSPQSASASAITQSSGGGSNFSARCAAPGVIRCNGFDNLSTDITPFIYAGQTSPGLDTAVKASGTGSVRFTIPSNSSANSSGSIFSPLGSSFSSHVFGQNSTFYVQFRQRFSPEMISNKDIWGSYKGWKQIIIHNNLGGSCAQEEITTQNTSVRGMPQMYTDCGANQYQIATGSGDYWLEQGDYNCRWNNGSGPYTLPNCAQYLPNQWMTFYYKVHIGTWSQPNSTVEAWVLYEGETTYKKWANWTTRINQNPPPASESGFNTIQLTPYHTDKSSSASHPTAYTWVDELIVSTQPIAAPGGATPPTDTTPPAAPRDLTAQ